jgi:hypothetical protein
MPDITVLTPKRIKLFKARGLKTLRSYSHDKDVDGP